MIIGVGFWGCEVIDGDFCGLYQVVMWSSVLRCGGGVR